MFSLLRFILPLLAAGFLHPAFSQSLHSSSTYPEVFITASRTAQSLENIQTDVLVVTREDIESSGFSQFSQLLESLPGVQVSSNGGGQQTLSVFLRGQASDSTLVLIDGIRMGPLSGFGGPTLQALPLEAVERVEILKGNGSALYGADALGGVIQVMTRKPTQNQFGVATTLGSNDTFGGQFNGAWVGDRARLVASGGYQQSRGYAVRPRGASGGNETRDPYHRHHGYVSLDYALQTDLSVSLSALNSESNAEYDSTGQQADSRVLQDLFVGSLRKNWEDGQVTSFRLGQSGEQLRYPGIFFYEARSYQTQAVLDHTIPTALGLVFLGAEKLKQDFESTSVGTVNQATSYAVLAGLTGEAADWSYQFNIRQDFNQQFKDALTGSFSLARELDLNNRFGFTLGTGFKRPSFGQISGFLSSTDNTRTAADVVNTSLRAQTSQSGELFYEWQSGVHLLKLRVFSILVNDQIENVQLSNGSSRSRNVRGDSESKGISVQFDSRVHEIDYGAFIEFLDTRLASGERRPRQAWRSGQLYAKTEVSPGLTAKADLVFAGRSRDTVFGQPDVLLGGYGIVNMALGYQLAPKSSLTLRVENLFGKQYEVVRQYNQPKQDVYLTFRHDF